MKRAYLPKITQIVSASDSWIPPQISLTLLYIKEMKIEQLVIPDFLWDNKRKKYFPKLFRGTKVTSTMEAEEKAIETAAAWVWQQLGLIALLDTSVQSIKMFVWASVERLHWPLNSWILCQHLLAEKSRILLHYSPELYYNAKFEFPVQVTGT